MRSLWPFRYLVAECMTRSAPSVSGRVRTGVAAVLSIARRAAALWASSATAAMSAIAQVGLAGVSSQISRVVPGRIAASSAARSLVSTRSTARPQGIANDRSQWRSPQYMTLGAITWSPGLSDRKMVVAAAMPEAKRRQPAPPSSAFRRASGCSTVGLSARP